jgi:hypothetical protein
LSGRAKSNDTFSNTWPRSSLGKLAQRDMWQPVTNAGKLG